MNHLGLFSQNGDLTKIGKSVADIRMLIASRKREIENSKKSRRTGGKK
jgi:hypothetical protein